MRLKVYGYIDHSAVIDEDHPAVPLASFYGGNYPFDHRALAYHYKNLMEHLDVEELTTRRKECMK